MSAAAKGENWEDALRAMRGLMELTEVYPDLLPPALDVVEGNLTDEVYKRTVLQEHPCLRCGTRATVAYLVTRRDDPTRRWLDVCPACAVLLKNVANDAMRRQAE